MSLLLLIALGLLLALFLMGRNASQTATEQAERDASERGQQGSQQSQQSQQSPLQSARESARQKTLLIANGKANNQITDQQARNLEGKSPEEVVAWFEGRISGKQRTATSTPLPPMHEAKSDRSSSAVAGLLSRNHSSRSRSI